MIDQPFLLRNQWVGWQIQARKGVAVDETIRLRPLPGAGQPLADSEGTFGGLAVPTALAVDPAGYVYALEGTQIRRYDPCDCRWQVLPGIGGQGQAPRRFQAPTGLTISARHNLYVADSGNRRVQLFALRGLALRAIWGPYRLRSDNQIESVRRAADGSWPPGTWQPWDVAVTPAGVAYVSDKANGLIHRFDSQGRWQAAYNGAGENGRTLVAPTHLALDQEGNLYIVQSGKDFVVVLDEAGRFVRRISRPEEITGQFAPQEVGVDPADRLYLSDGNSGRLYLVDGSTAIHCYAFRGKAAALTMNQAGNLLLADRQSGQIQRLQPGSSYQREGKVLVGPLDSRRYQCQWHRVELAAAVPPGTAIDIETFTADAPRHKDDVQALPARRWNTQQTLSRPGDEPWDCLVLSPPGRYLWLRLTLRGDGQQTPVIEQVRLDYPRRSPLRYLPAVFREEPESADFLGRFLSLFASLWDPVDDRLDRLPALFDPEATPADFLPWLASWLGLKLQEQWPEAVQRRVLAHAPELLAQWGTPAGLRLLLELVTGRQPYILEHFRLRRWLHLNQARLGAQSALWGPEVMDRLQLDVHSQVGDFRLLDSGDPALDPFQAYAHQFTVYLPWPNADESQKQIVTDLVEQAAPAHASGQVDFVEPRMRIGGQSLVGINTVVGRYPAGANLGKDNLGHGTVLGSASEEAPPPSAQIDRDSRIGLTSRLD